jgi:hypothetical protein
VSALEGSKGFVNDTVTGLPASAGPSLDNVAVGATSVTVTVVV